MARVILALLGFGFACVSLIAFIAATIYADQSTELLLLRSIASGVLALVALYSSRMQWPKPTN